mmetsp:Transcript_54118/g.118622  ORF Transcript_54118/g.118622 Transcript_54118/m.118622 type:complete len:446 (-) Transcript_54118:19-1356(-)
MAREAQEIVLDPWTCVPKKNEKYAKEAVELKMNNRAGTSLSPDFKRFPNVEVLWVNHNRLQSFTHLDTNFRIQHVYVQDNCLVSLTGLHALKFLRTLLAAGNQLRNLQKQIDVLCKFAFLTKLDLSGNPCSEEPDYRLRVLYHLPQLELHDRQAVKDSELTQANLVVPNLDEVSKPKPQWDPKPQGLLKNMSPAEVDCFTEARAIRVRMKKEEQEAYDREFRGGSRAPKLAEGDWGPMNKTAAAVREARLHRSEHELTHLTEWEKVEVTKWIAENCEPSLDTSNLKALMDTTSSTSDLGIGKRLDAATVSLEEGIGGEILLAGEEMADVFKLAGEDGVDNEVAAQWLVNQRWAFEDEDTLEMQIKDFFREAKKAEVNGQMAEAKQLSWKALKLEGVRTRRIESQATVVEEPPKVNKRGDIFPQLHVNMDQKGKTSVSKTAVRLTL